MPFGISIIYERPPKQEYWDYIIDRRDLLVPSDIRERKGAFFTPQIWAQKAQDSHYKDLIGNLNDDLQNLTKKIEPKIYEYGFFVECFRTKLIPKIRKNTIYIKANFKNT